MEDEKLPPAADIDIINQLQTARTAFRERPLSESSLFEQVFEDKELTTENLLQKQTDSSKVANLNLSLTVDEQRRGPVLKIVRTWVN